MKAIIVGGGQVGSYIGNLLVKNGNDVTIIDNRHKVIEKLNKEFDSQYILQGDGADPSVLESAGIGQTDVFIAVSGADEVNLVACTIAKYEFGVARCIARVNNPRNKWMFDQQMGVDVSVNQADILSKIVVGEIDLKNLFTLMKINRGEYSIVKFHVDAHSVVINQSLKDITLPDESVLIAILRNHEVVIPKGETIIEAGDSILALAHDDDTSALNQLFEDKK